MSIRNIFKSIAKFGLIAGSFAGIVALSAFAVIQILMRTGTIVEVPNVVGESFYAASRRLDAVGLRMKVQQEEYNSVFQHGSIIYQTPVEGSKVKIGRVVRVNVSLGTEEIAVPDVTGEELRQVAERVIIPSKLKTLRLEVGHVSQIHYPTKEKLILAQNPPPKSPIETGGKVDLLVSAGPRRARYLVPNVLGMKRDEAVQLLDRLNFQIQADPEYQPRVARNIVMKQEPEPNETLQEGGLVRLTVSARSREKRWENLRYLVVTYQVPLGISSNVARRLPLVRVEMTDALGTETVLRRTFEPGETIVEVISYKEEATVKVFVDGVLRQQTEIDDSETKNFTFIEPGRDRYGTQDSGFDSFRGLR